MEDNIKELIGKYVVVNKKRYLVKEIQEDNQNCVIINERDKNEIYLMDIKEVKLMVQRKILEESVSILEYEYTTPKREVRNVNLQFNIGKDGKMYRGGRVTSIDRLNEVVSSLRPGEVINFFEVDNPTDYRYIGDMEWVKE